MPILYAVFGWDVWEKKAGMLGSQKAGRQDTGGAVMGQGPSYEN